MLTLAEKIFSPVPATLNSRQTIILPNRMDVRAIFYGVARRPRSVEPAGRRPLVQPLLRAVVARRGAELQPVSVEILSIVSSPRAARRRVNQFVRANVRYSKIHVVSSGHESETNRRGEAGNERARAAGKRRFIRAAQRATFRE